MTDKLVYRGLRQVSDWALRFYSDVYVDGAENVPKGDPLILASCHHNEILDVAALSVAIPHGRPVCFWAKSSMFKNPLASAILFSSGSIPVTRNPNTTPPPTEPPLPPPSHSDGFPRDEGETQGEVGGYEPQVEDYEPQVEDYEPQVEDYEPQVEDYVDYEPQVEDYEPQVEDYVPQVESYEPQVESYEPQVESYEPQVEDYVPQVEDYVPQVEDYVPQVEDNVPQVEDGVYHYEAQVEDGVYQYEDQVEDDEFQYNESQAEDDEPPVVDDQPPLEEDEYLYRPLFDETIKALDREEVIGVFPEGTSYTEHRIAQVKDGASRAALEYVKFRRYSHARRRDRHLKIVPVGIVYTHKSDYQTRLYVGWGEPIDVEEFVDQKTAENKELAIDSREFVKALTAEIEKRMLELTINAPDWDSLHVGQMARDMLWADEEIPLPDFVRLSQNSIDLFADPNAAPTVAKARDALLRYHALLVYAGISHDALNAVARDQHVGRLGALLSLVRHLLVSVLHPRFWLFCPTLVLHIPAYAAGLAADRLLGNRDEPETRAQYKAVFGGLAAVAAYAAVAWRVVRAVSPLRILVNFDWTTYAGRLGRSGLRWGLDSVLMGGAGVAGKVKTAVGIFSIFYVTSFALSRWHNYWVASNYRQFKHLLASVKVFLGIMAPRSFALAGAELSAYTKPHVLPQNKYIRKQREEEDSEVKVSSTPTPTPRAPCVLSYKLIHPLLDAREEATHAMWSFLVDSKYMYGLVASKFRADGLMQIGPPKRHKNQVL